MFTRSLLFKGPFSSHGLHYASMVKSGRRLKGWGMSGSIACKNPLKWSSQRRLAVAAVGGGGLEMVGTV